jgi:hypothetical protein
MANGNTLSIGIGRSVGSAASAPFTTLPSPEEVFFNWLVSLPNGVCVKDAARQQIALIERRSLRHSDARRLRTLFVSVVRNLD